MTIPLPPCPQGLPQRLVAELRQACIDAGISRLVAAAVVKNAADLALAVSFLELAEGDAERMDYSSLAALHAERVHCDIETLGLRNASDRTHLASALLMSEWLVSHGDALQANQKETIR